MRRITTAALTVATLLLAVPAAHADAATDPDPIIVCAKNLPVVGTHCIGVFDGGGS